MSIFTPKRYLLLLLVSVLTLSPSLATSQEDDWRVHPERNQEEPTAHGPDPVFDDWQVHSEDEEGDKKGDPFRVDTPTPAQEEGLESLVKRYKRFKNQKSHMRAFCKGLEQDGHRKALFDLLEFHKLYFKECELCRNFYSALAVSCRWGKGENPKQRYPRVEVVNEISKVMASLVLDQELLPVIEPVFEHLLEILREDPRLTNEEKIYFAEIIPYIEEPVDRAFRRLRQDSSEPYLPSHEELEEKQQVVDDLFDF